MSQNNIRNRNLIQREKRYLSISAFSVASWRVLQEEVWADPPIQVAWGCSRMSTEGLHSQERPQSQENKESWSPLHICSCLVTAPRTCFHGCQSCPGPAQDWKCIQGPVQSQISTPGNCSAVRYLQASGAPKLSLLLSTPKCPRSDIDSEPQSISLGFMGILRMLKHFEN